MPDNLQECCFDTPATENPVASTIDEWLPRWGREAEETSNCTGQEQQYFESTASTAGERPPAGALVECASWHGAVASRTWIMDSRTFESFGVREHTQAFCFDYIYWGE